MLKIKLHKSMLKEALASVANISHATKASMYYTQDKLSLYVCETPAGMLIAVLHLLPSGFERFYCDKPGHVDIDPDAFSKLLNLAIDNDAITISFGDIRRMKTYRGDEAIKFRFKDLGAGKPRQYQMELLKLIKILWIDVNGITLIWPLEFLLKSLISVHRAGHCWINRKQCIHRISIWSNICGTGDSLSISISNEQLKFSARHREEVLVKELRQ